MADDNSQLEQLLTRVNIESMLEFETQIFLDIVQSDGLVVAAKGLNLDLIITNVMRVYQDPGNLVIVLNASDAEQRYFYSKLNGEYVYTEHGNEREEEYLCGGIHFISTRMLVVDLLKNRIPIKSITGIIVFRAHTILESCSEAFALRLYRQNNKTGFIKAFSNSAQSFTIGFAHIERIMRTLFVKELHIWPRFHMLVRENLKKHEPQLVELHIPITDKMKKLQTYILEIMNASVKELKRLNPALELSEITVENCLTKKFHKLLQAQLDEIWHQLSNKSCQLIAELKTLRHLILTLFYSNSVSFYSTLAEYRKAEYARTVDWVLNPSAELLFKEANGLIFSGNKEFNPEFCPKWEPLLEILKVEIPTEIRKSDKKSNNTILILCNDNRTCHQLNILLTNGPHFYLFFLALKYKIPFKTLNKHFENYQYSSSELAKNDNDEKLDNSKQKTRKRKSITKKNSNEEDTDTKINEDEDEDDDKVKEEVEEFQSTYILTMSQSVLDDQQQADETKTPFTPFTQMEGMDLTQICESIECPKILIQTFKGDESYANLQNNLQIIKPNFLIMYHSNVTAVREIEMYEAHRAAADDLKIYFLIHAGTVEEQAYLTSLRREKEAFEYLIETKATMVIPEDQDGKSDECLMLQRGLHLTKEKNTRAGGSTQSQEVTKSLIIVDMREFRSDLPSLIHKRGIDIEPVTITVGDYILTPDICVERKSMSDLIQSLNSGRLYQQCLQMQRYYSKPMLLIEFDHNRPFGWKNQYMLSANSDSFDVQQKLLLLTIHFPNLRLIWSPSPYATAQLFEELKQGKLEPNVENAMAIGSNEDLDVIETQFNSTIYDFVQKLPGITSKNIWGFLRKGQDLKNVISKTEDELQELLGNSSSAKALYSALHQTPKNEETSNKKSKYKKYGPSTSKGAIKKGKSKS